VAAERQPELEVVVDDDGCPSYPAGRSSSGATGQVA
jgi:hypothetical protein